jgi:hypothetical protein
MESMMSAYVFKTAMETEWTQGRSAGRRSTSFGNLGLIVPFVSVMTIGVIAPIAERLMR